MVERTRNGDSQRSKCWSWRWRSAILRLAGLGWHSAAALQCLWHATSLLETGKGMEEGTEPSSELSTFMGDSATAFPRYRLAYFYTINERMNMISRSFMPAVLFLAVSTLWWNNKLRRKYLGVGGRMVGKLDYYALQLVSFVIKVLAFWVLSGRGNTGLSADAINGAHTFMIIFVMIVSSTSPSPCISIDPQVVNIFILCARHNRPASFSLVPG